MQERWGMPLTPSAEERVSHYSLMPPLSFNTSYEGVTVLKQRANRVTLLMLGNPTS